MAALSSYRRPAPPARKTTTVHVPDASIANGGICSARKPSFEVKTPGLLPWKASPALRSQARTRDNPSSIGMCRATTSHLEITARCGMQIPSRRRSGCYGFATIGPGELVTPPGPLLFKSPSNPLNALRSQLGARSGAVCPGDHQNPVCVVLSADCSCRRNDCA